MATWKKVIVSGSQAHLQGITASGDVSASGNLSITGTSTLTGRLTANGAISTTNITASGNISSSAGLIGQTLSISGVGTIGGLLTANGAISTTNITASGNISSSGNLTVAGTSTLMGRLTANGAITTTNITASGNISSSGNLIVTGNITASGLPQSTTPQIVGYNTITGGLSYFDTSSIVTSAAAAVQTFKTVSVGGVSLQADNSTDTLIIASGSFGGVATTRNNLLLSGSQDDTLTISFLDSPIFTHITASGNISSSGNLTVTGNSTIGGTLGVTGLLTANGAITTTNLTASGNISSSAGLIGGTLTTSGGATVGGNVVVTGDLAVNSSGIGITAVNITASNNLLVSNNLIVNGNTTLGNEANDSVTVNAQTVTLNSQLSAIALSNTMLVITSSNRVAAQTLGTGVATFLNIPSSTNLAAAVTDETGTGTLVFSSSPTFTGTLGATDITTTGNVIVGGDLTVNGETTIINTSTLSIEDKFIVLGRSSGSQTPASEGGIIIEGAGGSGSAFVFNSGSGANVSNRWGVALGVPTGSMNVTPTDFMVTVSSSVVSPTDSNAPTYGGANGGFGNMHINTADGEIWIYV